MKRSFGWTIDSHHLLKNQFRDVLGVSEGGDEYVDEYDDRFILDEATEPNPKSAKSVSIEIHSHLLLAHFFPNSYSYNHWIGEIGGFIRDLKDYLCVTKDNVYGNTNARLSVIEDWDMI